MAAAFAARCGDFIAALLKASIPFGGEIAEQNCPGAAAAASPSPALF